MCHMKNHRKKNHHKQIRHKKIRHMTIRHMKKHRMSLSRSYCCMCSRHMDCSLRHKVPNCNGSRDDGNGQHPLKLLGQQ